MINMMNSFMLLGAKGADAASAVKPGQKESLKSEESFTGIFKEKMNDVSRASRKPQTQAMDKPLMKADREEVKADKTVTLKTPETPAQAKASIRKPDEAGRRISDEEGGKPEPEAKETTDSGSEAMNVLSMVATLLESLFANLEKVTDTTGENSGNESQVTMEGENASSIQILRLKLEGKLEELQKLLTELDPQNSDAETGELAASLKSLLEQLDSLNAKQNETRNASGINLKLDVQVKTSEDESRKSMLLKLKAHGEDILDKLKLKITTLEKATGQASLTGTGSETEGIPATAGLSEDPSAQMNDKSDAKAEIKAAREQDKGSEKTVLKDEPVPVTEQKPEAEQVLAQASKPDTKIEPKAVKSEFQLSEKPLAQTVTHQVMLKVKLMAGENKQEMEMHLKPESLGKLTLKIIHERGEIVAKITAENEQVKSILESNMQTLKDSLEKSGLSVQSLSVSVGNGKGQNNSQEQESNQRNKSFGAGSMRQAEERRSIPQSRIFAGSESQVGSYKIDLTA